MNATNNNFGLSFTLNGEYACWREPLIAKSRVSNLFPCPTRIIGMIGSSLGFSREKTYSELQNKINVGIKILDIRGFLEENVQLHKNVKGNRIERTIEKIRVLVEPKYKIFLKGNKEIINNIEKAIYNPIYPIFLGSFSEHIGEINDVNKYENIKNEKVKDVYIETLIEEEIIENNYNILISDTKKYTTTPKMTFINKKWDYQREKNKPIIEPKIVKCLEFCNVKLKVLKPIDLWKFGGEYVYLF